MLNGKKVLSIHVAWAHNLLRVIRAAEVEFIRMNTRIMQPR